jgi:PTS system nitrogen regulatory IIA component
VDDQVLDAREAASLLGVGEDVVLEEAASGNLPGRRIGGEWRFSHARLLAWLREQPGGSDVQERDFDRLLAAQPDEPPSPAEQADRDDNDAPGDP